MKWWNRRSFIAIPPAPIRLDSIPIFSRVTSETPTFPLVHPGRDAPMEPPMSRPIPILLVLFLWSHLGQSGFA